MNKTETSNRRAQATWTKRPVGSQRADSQEGTPEFFDQVRSYRYGYETPWIPAVFRFGALSGKSVLEIGVGLGIDACEMIENGAFYTGLDITRKHLDLTRLNLEQHFSRLPDFKSRVRLIEGDLLTSELKDSFDVIYSFGVLHHIEHEEAYLEKLETLLKTDGRLRIAVYAKLSVFNIYMIATWLLVDRMRHPLNSWQAHLAEGSSLDAPVTIKIRNKKEVDALLERTGFRVVSYCKRGFVQNYLPLIGKRFRPDGRVLNALGGMLGWYHCFECARAK